MKILDYIRGNRKGKDARGIEYDAMSDPFLADALDGYDSVEGDHTHCINQMQARVMKYSNSKRKNSLRIWRASIAAVILLALLSGYFALMNHQSNLLLAKDQNTSYINLYIPEGYVENKRLELTVLKEENPSLPVEATALVDITNLHEILMPVERMTIYIPNNYAQLNGEDLNNLSSNNIESKTRSVDNNMKQFRIVESKHLNRNDDIDLMIATDSIYLVEKNIPLAESISDNNSHKTKVSLSSSSEFKLDLSRDVTVSGRVTDENNQPLLGASVAVKGTSNATVTDIDGNYSLKVDSNDLDLIVNYFGYQTIEVPNAKNNQAIAMKEDKRSLSEVVVVSRTANRSGISKKISVKDAKIENLSQPVNGLKQFEQYIHDNMVRPVDSACKNTSGVVILEFNIDKAGRPVDIVVSSSLCESFDKEAIRLLKAGPDWVRSTLPAKVEVRF